MSSLHPLTRILTALAGLLFCAHFGVAQPGGTIEIVQTGRVYEGAESRWAAVLKHRPMGRTGELKHELPVDFRWNFGGDSGIVSSGERPSLVYSFDQDGSYTVRIEAWSEGAVWAAGETSVTVRNRQPSNTLLSAVEIDPATATFELTVDVDDTAADTLTYEWDFGDGETTSGVDLWRVEHAYPLAGTYPVTVIITDGDESAEPRTKSMRLVSYAAGEGSGDTVDALDDEPTTEQVNTSFEAELSGTLGTDFIGEVRPLASLFLSPIDGGQRCRFMFTAWDPGVLAFVTFIADMNGLPEEGGARYSFRPPRASVNYYPTAEQYEGAKRTALGPFSETGIGGAVAGMVGSDLLSLLGPGGRADVGRMAGVDPQARADAGEASPPVATSPFFIDQHEGFEAQHGDFEMTFIPHDRAVGTFNLALLNGRDSTDHRQINLRGKFSIDLGAARSDGMMLYEHCKPAEFSIESRLPEPDTMHVYTKTPRVRVRFSGAYDPATANPDTFQLTYPAAGSGDLTPVEIRIYRRDDIAYLEPVEPLWGGVHYTVRMRTGRNGVRGRNGAALEAEGDSEWVSWRFATRLDLASSSDGGGQLSCHVFQPVRDASLIPGKMAAARIYATWKERPEVAREAQVPAVRARVSLVDRETVLGSTEHEFLRPDLWVINPTMTKLGLHTANVLWTPQAGRSSTTRVQLELLEKPGEEWKVKHRASCATPMWNRRPERELATYLLVPAGADAQDLAATALPAVETLTMLGTLAAESMLPVARVKPRPVRTIQLAPGCDQACALETIVEQTAEPFPDLILGYHRTGSGVPYGTGPYSGPVALELVDPDDLGAGVHTLVKHLAYTMGLENGPNLPAAGLQPGIEAFSILDPAAVLRNYPDFEQRWEQLRLHGSNKSSTEGNAQADNLNPLMDPGDHLRIEVFTQRHRYLEAMEWLEANP